MNSGHLKWSKFWWDDYEHDSRLKLCSLAAQGLWMRMLCIMHRASPRGYLQIDGDAVSVDQLAALSGKKFKEIFKLFEELREKKVFSLSENGVAYSRKMVHQTQKTEQFSEYGRSGGNPSLLGKDSGRVNPTLNLQEEERNRGGEEKKDSDASHLPPGGAASPPEEPLVPKPIPFRKQAWDEGKRIVSELTGMTAKDAGSFVGEMGRIMGSDYSGLLAIFHAAEAKPPMDAKTWLMAAANARANPERRRGKPEAFAEYPETPEVIFLRRYQAGEIDRDGRELKPAARAANDAGLNIIDGELA